MLRLPEITGRGFYPSMPKKDRVLIATLAFIFMAGQMLGACLNLGWIY